MKRSLDESIVIQAINDLLHEKEKERTAALSFFLQDGHVDLCLHAWLNAEGIKEKIMEAAQYDGVRREKLIGDLLSVLKST